MHAWTLQDIAAVFGIVTGIGTVAATVVCLKISQQIANLRAHIAETYATKEDLRAQIATGQQRKAAHA
jgi:hypothetical protein